MRDEYPDNSPLEQEDTLAQRAMELSQELEEAELAQEAEVFDLPELTEDFSRQEQLPQYGYQQPQQYGYQQPFDMYYGVPPQQAQTPAVKKKKPWGKLIAAILLAIAAAALLIWGAVSGVNYILRQIGGNGGSSGSGDNSGILSPNFPGGGDNNSSHGNTGGNTIVFPTDTNGGYYFIDENGNLVPIDSGYIDENGNFIFNGNGSIIIITEPQGGDTPSVTDPGMDNGTVYYVYADGGLNMRESPSTSGNRLCTIPNGTALVPSAWENGWAMVEYDGMVGWVSGDYLFTVPPTLHEIRYVQAEGGLNMRAEPSTDGKKILSIPNHAKVTVYHRDSDWSFVSYNGQEGWCKNDYLVVSLTQGEQTGYTQAEVDKAIADAMTFYRNRKGQTPSTGRFDDSLTKAEVEELYWNAVSVTYIEYFPVGQFKNRGEYLVIDGKQSYYVEVWDDEIVSLEDWADKYYSVLTDDVAYEYLGHFPLFILDGKMYISDAAMGDEGLRTEYTIDVKDLGGSYRLTMDVITYRYNYATDTETPEYWSVVANCFKEDGVWVFDRACSPYQ